MKINKPLTKAIQQAIPFIYTTEDIPMEKKVCHVKYFGTFTSWQWYATEAYAYVEELDENGAKSGEPKSIPLSEFEKAINYLPSVYRTENYGSVLVHDVLFFGWVNGHFPEWGEFSLQELGEITGKPFGLPLERDLYGGFPKKMEDIRVYQKLG